MIGNSATLLTEFCKIKIHHQRRLRASPYGNQRFIQLPLNPTRAGDLSNTYGTTTQLNTFSTINISPSLEL
jgi:hypothetical protein